MKDQDVDAPADMPEIVDGDDDGMPDLADTSDDENNNAEANAPSAEAEVRPNAEAKGPSAGAEAPTLGADTRGPGLEAFEGMGSDRSRGDQEHNPTSEHLARVVADQYS